MSSITKILVILTVAMLLEAKYYRNIMGPFKGIVNKIERCPPETVVKDHITYTYQELGRIAKGQDHTINAELRIPFNINNSVSVHGDLASWSNMGGWKENAFVFNLKEACTQANAFKPIANFIRSMGINLFGQPIINCPLLAGIYRVSNFTVKFPQPPVKYFVYGRWKARAMLVLPSGGFGSCVVAYVETIPA